MLNLILLVALYFSPSLDDGIGIDPNGGRTAATAGDHRCTIDPNGGACTTSTLAGDRGAGLDPDGGN